MLLMYLVFCSSARGPSDLIVRASDYYSDSLGVGCTNACTSNTCYIHRFLFHQVPTWGRNIVHLKLIPWVCCHMDVILITSTPDNQPHKQSSKAQSSLMGFSSEVVDCSHEVMSTQNSFEIKFSQSQASVLTPYDRQAVTSCTLLWTLLSLTKRLKGVKEVVLTLSAKLSTIPMKIISSQRSRPCLFSQMDPNSPSSQPSLHPHVTSPTSPTLQFPLV